MKKTRKTRAHLSTDDFNSCDSVQISIWVAARESQSLLLAKCAPVSEETFLLTEELFSSNLWSCLNYKSQGKLGWGGGGCEVVCLCHILLQYIMQICMWERGRKVGFALCKPCVKVDHCHQQWLMALLLHVNTAVTGWEITGMKRSNFSCFLPWAAVFLTVLASKLKTKAGHSLEPQMLNHLLYFMTTKFCVVDTPHQHPAVSSLACYINQVLCFLHGHTTHQSCIDLWASHNMDTPVRNLLEDCMDDVTVQCT